MKLRGTERLASLASVGLLLLLAAGTYYLVEKAANLGPAPERKLEKGEPDSFVEGLSLTKLNAKGEPTFRLTAKKMRHFPADGSTEYEQPLLVSLDKDRPRLTVSAKKAWANAGGETTELTDDVVLVREASAQGPKVRVSSAALTLLTEQEIARTSEEVKIEYASSVLIGKGLEFNHGTRQLELMHSVRGSYVDERNKAK